ncbi:hypothetical protein IPM62_01175 [Candidatus Woesebacteria bacterium]|nr:MAG: hypothetical protein IPM62_01175 [Candidatus Woesebacteria bacterium]
MNTGQETLFLRHLALTLGDKDIAKKNLDLFTAYQKPSGHIALRIEDRFHGLGFLGLNIKHRKLLAKFKPSQPWADKVIDSNPLYLIAVAEYVNTTKDVTWIERNREKIVNAVYWLTLQIDKNGLVKEGLNANWADFTFKRGNVLYTNILAWKAFNLLCNILPTKEANYCLSRSDQIELAIKKNFWNDEKGFFIDNIGKHGKKHNVFASDGNLLAIFFDFTTSDEAQRIFNYIDKNKLDRIPVPIYFPRLTGRHNILNRLIFPNYNSTYTFIWWGSISAVSRMKIFDNDGALNDLYAIAKIINRYKTVPEIVNPKGRMVDKLFYKSERSAAWSAGMFVYACNIARDRKLILF